MTDRIDFIVAGPQRTASSWLHQMLQRHPGVSLPREVKETFFWDKRYGKGWAWYGKFFVEEAEGSGRLRGEVAPTVFASDAARERIRDAAPGCRIVILLRDPVERTLSHFRHETALGLVRGSLKEAVRTDPRILEASRYSKYLPRWRACFPGDQILCLSQKAIETDPSDVLRQLCRFLGVGDPADFSGAASRPSRAMGVRFPRVARLLYLTASRLRSFHLHRLVNLGKAIGVRKLVQDSRPARLSEEDRKFAEEALGGEREFVEGLMARR